MHLNRTQTAIYRRLEAEADRTASINKLVEAVMEEYGYGYEITRKAVAASIASMNAHLAKSGMFIERISLLGRGNKAIYRLSKIGE